MHLSVSPDGRWATTSDYEQNLLLWDVPAGGGPPAATRLPERRHVCACWAGGRLAAGGSDGRVRLLDPARRRWTVSPVLFDNAVTQLAAVPPGPPPSDPAAAGPGAAGGVEAYAVSPEGTGGRYALPGGRRLWATPKEHRGPAFPEFLAPAGPRHVLCAFRDYGGKGLFLLDAADGTLLAAYPLPRPPVEARPLGPGEAFLILRRSEDLSLTRSEELARDLARWSAGPDGGAVVPVERDVTSVAAVGERGVAYGARDGSCKLLVAAGPAEGAAPRTLGRMPAGEQVNAVAAGGDLLAYAGSEGTLLTFRAAA